MVVQVSKCWATPTPNKDDANKYIFIDNYGVPATEKDNVAIDVNCEGSKAEFWFNSFSFSGLRPAGKTLIVRIYNDQIAIYNRTYV